MLNNDSGRRLLYIFLLIENRFLRECLARLIRKRSGLRVVGESQYSESAITQVVQSACDVLLLDYPSVISSPVDLIPHIVTSSPRTRVILFGMTDDPSSFLKAVQSGVTGYLLGNASAVDIVAAVRGVARGEAVCPPGWVSRFSNMSPAKLE